MQYSIKELIELLQIFTFDLTTREDQFLCELFPINEEITISCTVDKSGLSACLDSCKEIGRSFEFTKVFDEPGAYPILIKVKKENLQKISTSS